MKLKTLFETKIINYSDLQKAMIMSWGRILYLGYKQLPIGKGNKSELLKEIKFYFKAIEDGDEDEILDFEEWFQEGCPVKENGVRTFLLTKDLLDEIFQSCETEISEPLVVAKFGKRTSTAERWTSVTTDINTDVYNRLGDKNVYTLPVGTKVIFTNDLADKDEIIINNKYLK